MDGPRGNRQPNQGPAHSPGPDIDLEKILPLLRTPYNEVYELSADGETYSKPFFLRGTPVQKINETSPYWSASWKSLDAYIAQEAAEERAKADWSERARLRPNENTHKNAKLHKDNVSKQRKIREIFGGNSRPHPNQITSKQYLPSEGLCEQELMYLMGCKISDLEVLSREGTLVMEPWDFFRWRVGQTLVKTLRFPGQNARKQLRRIIHNISSGKSEDPLFRQIILYSADRAGHANRYGTKKVVKPYKIDGRTQEGAAAQYQRQIQTRQPSAPARQPRQASSSAPVMTDEERQRLRERRQARQAQRASQSIFQGVNAYRRDRVQPSGGPCGS